MGQLNLPMLIGNLHSRFLQCQDANGSREDLWMKTSVRVTDLAIAPDLSRMVVVGLDCLLSAHTSSAPSVQEVGPTTQQPMAGTSSTENRLIIYSYASRTQEACVFSWQTALGSC